MPCPRLRRNEAAPPKEGGPRGGLAAACDGHAWFSGCCCCVRVRIGRAPATLPKETAQHKPAPLAPSSAPDAMAPRSQAHKPDHPSRPRHQLVNVLRPARRDSLGTADAATAASPAPSGRPFHARGSLLSGARKAYRSFAPMSRVEAQCHCALHSLRSDAPKNCLRSPARRSTPHPSTSGTPSVYYASTTMSSYGCRRLPRRDNAWITIQQREVALGEGPDALKNHVGRRVLG
jgi:hypothetical protein